MNGDQLLKIVERYNNRKSEAGFGDIKVTSTRSENHVRRTN